MSDYRLFPRIFSSVVERVRQSYDSVNEIYPVYEFGTYLQLTRMVKLREQNVVAKYPLVWLVWEANESKQSWKNSLWYTVTPRLFICNFTKTEYTSDERYTNNFENILYPIFDLIKLEINADTNISYFGAKSFETWEHLYWGESLGVQKQVNKLFDTLDALEVRFTELKVTPGDC